MASKGLTKAEQAVAFFMEHMDDHMLQCRVTGRHIPPMVTDSRKTHFTRRKDGVFQKEWRCLMCGTKVVELSKASGYLDDRAGSPRYDWPEGYRLPQGVRDVGAGVIRSIARREARRRNAEHHAALERARRANRKGGSPVGQALPTGDRAKSRKRRTAPLPDMGKTP